MRNTSTAASTTPTMMQTGRLRSAQRFTAFVMEIHRSGGTVETITRETMLAWASQQNSPEAATSSSSRMLARAAVQYGLTVLATARHAPPSHTAAMAQKK